MTENNQTKVMMKTLQKWREDETPKTAPRRLHRTPCRPRTTPGRRQGRCYRMERTRLNGTPPRPAHGRVHRVPGAGLSTT
ncbi:hypothetical protein QJS66_15870 [Kocuria rhizophila]|nr:hypothetical protein QJS66_15870 [Kocuria rhizophila]